MLLCQVEPTSFGLLSLIPCLVVFVAAVLTRRTVEPLLAGCLVGFVMSKGWSFFDGLVESLLKVMKDDVIVWVILVCGLFGALNHILIKSGGAQAFGQLMARWIKGRVGVLVGSWVLGIAIFVDDYLNALTVGSAMSGLAKRYRVSKAMLAYVVDSTAAPVCLLVPFSTWAFYVAGLLESNGVAEKGTGLQAYVSLIPFLVYAWAAGLLVLLVAIGVVPVFGPMRHEEKRAAEHQDDDEQASEVISSEDTAAQQQLIPLAATFFLSIAILVSATLFLGGTDETRVLKAILLALAVTIPLSRAVCSLRFSELADAALEGFGKMTPALAIIVCSFVLKDVNEALGLTDFVIGCAKPWLTSTLAPATVFIALSVVTFATGSYWGTYAITLPIVIPLAQQVGANVPLTIGAVVSAGAFGSHACFYGDATVLSSVSTGCDTMTHAITQFPYALLAAGVSVLVFLLLGAML